MNPSPEEKPGRDSDRDVFVSGGMLPESQGTSELTRRATVPLRPGPGARRLALISALVVVASIALRPLWIALVPLLPECTFRRLTGIPCPTCGSTRAAVALLDADLGAAFKANPLVAAIALLVLAVGLTAPVWTLTGLPVPRHPPWRWLLLAAVTAVLANWAYLIAAR